jgi:hypothetical protein
MAYRTAADPLKQVFPVDAAKHPETLRRHTLKAGEGLASSDSLWPGRAGLAAQEQSV